MNKHVKENHKTTTYMLQILLLLITLLPMTGCRTVLVAPPPPPPQQHYTPPSYEYQYYPDQQVYYDTYNDIYFYQEHGHWYSVTDLPISIDIYGAIWVPFTLETQYPYHFHKQHRRQHPPRKKHRKKRRMKHHYWYYPNYQIYYDYTLHIYFFMDRHGYWQQNRRPPRHFHPRSSYYEELSTEDNTPYKHHPRHKKRFPGKKKKKQPKPDYSPIQPPRDSDYRYRSRIEPEEVRLDRHPRKKTTPKPDYSPFQPPRDSDYRDRSRIEPEEVRLDRHPRKKTTPKPDYSPFQPPRDSDYRDRSRIEPEEVRLDRHPRKKKTVRQKHPIAQPTRFQYYPDAQIYYDMDQSVYYFKKGNTWRKNKKLPKYIKLDNARHYEINPHTDKPHKQHNKYLRQYPPHRR